MDKLLKIVRDALEPFAVDAAAIHSAWSDERSRNSLAQATPQTVGEYRKALQASTLVKVELDRMKTAKTQNTRLDASDLARLEFCLNTLTGLKNLGRHNPLGDKWPEVVIVLDALKTVLRPTSEGSPVRAPLAPLQSAEERAGRA